MIQLRGHVTVYHALIHLIIHLGEVFEGGCTLSIKCKLAPPPPLLVTLWSHLFLKPVQYDISRQAFSYILFLLQSSLNPITFFSVSVTAMRSLLRNKHWLGVNHLLILFIFIIRSTRIGSSSSIGYAVPIPFTISRFFLQSWPHCHPTNFNIII